MPSGACVHSVRALTAIVSLCLWLLPPASVAQQQRPNFIIILSDDQRWDTVDATHQSPGRPGPVMPWVTSELINSGVTFTNGHVTTALCCPSRTSILTGQYSHRTGVLDNNPPDGGAQAFDDSSTIATWLQAAGYRTAASRPTSRRAGTNGMPRCRSSSTSTT